MTTLYSFRSAWLPVLCLALLMGGGLGSAALAGGKHGSDVHDPFEPTVTREESRLLEQALNLADTDTAGAIELLRESDPEHSSPALDFAIGNLFFQDDQLNEAAAAYEAAVKKLPKFRSAIMNLGRIYLLQDQTGKAIELYQHLVADGQADADILLLLGHALLMEDAPVSAESAYRQCLLLSPKNADAMLGLAKVLMLQSRFAEGLALVGEILAADPVNRELWSLQANAYLSLNQYADAARTIEQAHRLHCADREMLATQGDLLLNRDQPRDALQAYEEAFKGDTPSLNRLLRSIEGFLMLGDQASAIRMIQRTDELQSRDSEAFDEDDQIRLLRLKAELAQQQEDASEAMSLCRQVLDIDPLDGRSLLLLARLQKDAGLLEDSVMTCERAARVTGIEADALVLHAQIEIQRERYDQAVPLLEAAQVFENQPHVARYLEQVRRMTD